MKRVFLFLLSLCICHSVFANTQVYMQDGKFGLKDDTNKIITEPKYRKLIKLGESSWIMQDGIKYGIIHDNGMIITEPKYNQAERVLGEYVKFRKGDKYGIIDENGFEILPVEFSSIDLLYGGMFVTSKNYKYGITDMNGQLILDNAFEDIYMPDFYTLILVHNGKMIEIKKKQGEKFDVPIDIQTLSTDLSIVKLSDITSSPVASTGYYSVTLTDYILKLFSSISPAYEQTIDELIFSQGADTVSVLMKCSWLPKFPFVYAKNYYQNVTDPYNGPLSKTKKFLQRKVKS